MKKDIMICGVGGQGTVLASKIIASSAMVEGNSVHSAETIGMAQRGGPVTSHVRVGEDAFSPLIPVGGADLLIAFEPSEAVRNLRYLKKDGFVIVNSVPVKPTSLGSGEGYDGKAEIEFLKSIRTKAAIQLYNSFLSNDPMMLQLMNRAKREHKPPIKMVAICAIEHAEILTKELVDKEDEWLQEL
jgi:indolepyruvate ferredoxin oxidoreductase beta subunit